MRQNMNKDITIKPNANLAIQKAKSLMNITDKILLNNNKMDLQDDSWIYRLWEWADDNYITDLEWVENIIYDNGGYWQGLPRNKEKLLNLSELNLNDCRLTEIPKEIVNLSKLTKLNLNNCQLSKLPKEIGYLSPRVPRPLKSE